MENNVMELVKQKKEIEMQINEKLGINKNDKNDHVNELLRLNSLLQKSVEKYQGMIEQNLELVDRVAHTSNKQSYKEMLYIDFLDLKNANDSKTHEEFKNYIEIIKKKPQINHDLDTFKAAVNEIESFHLEDDFFNNEYGLDERTDGLDVESCKNDFKEINNKLKVTVNE